MSPATIFNLHLVLGYVAWLLCTTIYIWPTLRAMSSANAQRSIAMLHSFRFFGLAFILPGVVGHGLPATFATFAAYGDFATGLLAIVALFTRNLRPLFGPLVVSFNLVGAADILVDYYHGVKFALPAISGELGATYAIVTIYVPLLMITHFIAFYLMLRQTQNTAPDAVRDVGSQNDRGKV